MLPSSKNFNHRKLSQILKYFRKQFHISYISLGIEVSLMFLASLILCSSLLSLYIYVECYLVSVV